ncbi:MAG: hypothetical protein K2Y31_03955 [Burkholderiales bacterium]|nr:hypothetical protein [Burkholderiales bacterium]
MILELPRPCRYEDLTRASESGELLELALIADGEPAELAAAIRAWGSAMPATRMNVFHTPVFSEALSMATAADNTITAIEVRSYNMLNQTPQATTCRVWSTCSPYDAYGVLVKKDLESITYNIIRRNGGIYFAHDPAYGVVRWFSADGLLDRLRYRGIRLLIYRLICCTGLGLSWMASRFSAASLKWRKIRPATTTPQSRYESKS